MGKVTRLDEPVIRTNAGAFSRKAKTRSLVPSPLKSPGRMAAAVADDGRGREPSLLLRISQ